MKRNLLTWYERIITRLYVKTSYGSDIDYITIKGRGDDCVVDICTNKTTSDEDRLLRQIIKTFTYSPECDDNCSGIPCDCYQKVINNLIGMKTSINDYCARWLGDTQ